MEKIPRPVSPRVCIYLFINIINILYTCPIYNLLYYKYSTTIS